MFGFGKRKGEKRSSRDGGGTRGRGGKSPQAETPPADEHGHSPIAKLVLTDIVLSTGGALLRNAVERGVLGKPEVPKKTGKIFDARTMRQTIIGAALTRVATRSVPGAILIGGGMLAKTLYDHHRAAREEQERQRAERAKPAKRSK